MKKYLFLIASFLTALVASGATYYVVPNGAGSKNGTSWANAYADVQTAIDSASSAGGGEVWIAKGTYKHGSAMTMKNNVTIYGGFAGTETSKDQRVAGNETVLDGEGKYRVFYNNYTESNLLTNSAKLDNVTIQNGYYSGAGMYNYYASPKITNCTFSNNSADFGGGMKNYSSSPVLTNCTFTNNSASYGGGMYNNSSSPVLTNCTFTNNSASSYGGGMYNTSSSSAVLTNCTFSNNSADFGGGMENYSSSPVLTNCTFTNNSASSYGGGMYNDNSSSPVLTNCTFSNNSASQGGGMYNDSSSPVLTNCTFSNNSAKYSGGGMDNRTISSPKLTNCILWGNTVSSSGNEINNDNSGNKPTIDTCIIKGGYSSSGTYTNIITADPKLIPLGNYGGNVQTCPVGAGSSAIGAGKMVDDVTTDARGFVRSTTPTIGACEFANKLTVASISTSEGYLKYSSSYEFTLNALSEGTNLTYQWYKDGKKIEGATLSSYKTSQTAGTSKYTVVVSDGTTTITSSEIAIETVDTPRYYVSTIGNSSNDGLSWATAKSDVQEAIDLAFKYYGSEVWIAKGTYKHGSAMTMKNGVAIYGGFAGTETSKEERVAGNNTILDGEDKYRVFYNNYTSSNPLTNSAKLDNVTIQNGYAGNGAGMYNYFASPEITNCTFSNNSASYDGGMYNRSNSSPVLTNCTFSNNSGGGMGNNYSSSPVLTNCTFSNNSASHGGGMSNSNSSSPELANCTFTSNSASYGGGMSNYYSSSPVLTNCTFSNNSASRGGGMYNSSSSPELANCTFSNNSASDDGGGMYNSSPTSPKLTNCILWGNTASSSGNEIYNDDSNNKPTIDTCIIKGGYSSYGTYTNIITADPKLMPLGNYGGSVQTCLVGAGSSAVGAGKVVDDVTTDARGVARSSTPTIGACEYSILDCNPSNPPFVKTEECIAKYSSSYEFTLNMFITGDNLTYQWYKDGIAIEGATSSSYKTKQDAGTSKYTVVVSDGTTTITSSEIAIETINPIHVSKTGSSENDGLTWATAKSDVQEAIDLASSHNAYGMEVWIAKGTYKHGSAMIMKNGVAIYGGFAGTEISKDQRVAGNNTILDGEGKYRVFYNNYREENPLTNSAKLDNVTIQNGYTSDDGAGMYNYYASPEITNCTLSNNSAYRDGGGMYNDFSSSPVLTNCTFTNNSASSRGGGMANYNSSSPVLTNCTFTNNSASSRGGGMYNGYSSSPVLTNCTFSNNSATGDYSSGGGMYNEYSSSPVLTNCTFSNNSASSDGGGMCNYFLSPELINCTFTNNSASSGGGMYNYSSNPSLTNCILWGNTASSSGNEIYNYNSNSNPTIDTCIIKGGYSSYGTYTNIITADPKLMPLGNYGGSVQTCPVGAGSSAIGAGKVVDDVTTDARGFIRSVPYTIGAWQYSPTEITSNLEDIAVWANTDATLTVSIEGDNPTYQWQYSEDGSTWYDIEGETSSTLTLSNVPSSQNGYKYRCAVDSDKTDLTYSSVAILTVKPSPSIATQPEALGIFTNNDGSLSVSAIGESLTFQWYFDGKAIEGATESTLSFDNIQFDKTGSYYCVITNPAGSVQSSTANVVVHQTARITKGLTNVQAVKEIGYARFEIESDSYNPTIKWYIGGVEFTGEDLDEDPKVLFFNVGSTIRTTVKCVLSTADGKEVSSQANLMCIDASASNAPIKIAQQPTDTQPIAWGETASFTASATAGSTVVNYQWQISTDSETWEDIEGANASTCSFKMEDYKKCFVRCEINNGNGAYLYSDVAKIMHSITPSAQTPDEMWLYDGDTDDVEFGFDVGEDGMKFQWQMSLDDGITWIDIENADDDLFYITMTSDLDGVKVRCKYWTTTSQFTSNITTLRFATLVEITREPEVYTDAKLYSTVPLSVEAMGYNLQYQWQISTDGETWNDIENATLSKLNVFVIEDVAFNYYRCYIYNKDEEGNVRSEAYTDFLEHGIVLPTSEEDKFGKWAYDNKLKGDNALPTATPYNDGITNLEKFTFGLDASKATSYDANANFKHTSDATGASLQFPVSVDAESVVQVNALKSVDLINWEETTVTATGETSSDGKFKIYKATVPIGEEGKVFLKLKVEEK